MSAKKKLNTFYTIAWDCNRKVFEPYDIMPYLRDCYKKEKKSRSKCKLVPTTFEEFTKFVKSELMYRYWGRCEYEIILADWPSQKTEKKIDIWWQCEPNLDLITRLLMEDVL